jgi:GTP-binding protein
VLFLFLDRVKVFIRSGNGGSGAVSFRREKYVSRGGPDGGDGGRGGHIIFTVRDNLSTLSDFQFKHHFQAENGKPGEGGNRTGRDGEDLFIPVPVGTIIKNAETNEIIADLSDVGAEFIILRGGRGGRGNVRFATATRQTPQFSEKGEQGIEIWVELELKLLADVGLIGFPNTGKSTLLSSISAAKPKIADYPFTTIIPNLGVVSFKGQSFVAIDIPGLIEGAHQGIGLGDQFLKHVERTRLLVHLVDVSSYSGRNPFEDLQQINDEIRLFNPELAKKPQIIAANKIDVPEAKQVLETLCSKITPDIKIFPISAYTGQGLDELLNQIIEKLAVLPLDSGFVPIPDKLKSFEDDYTINIVKEGNLFIVQNKELLRRVARFDFENDDSIRSLQKLLKSWGVIKALSDAGVKEGDSVKIGDFEFIYLSEE